MLSDLPGGSWTVGLVRGLVTVLGCVGGWALVSQGAGGAGRPGSLVRVVGSWWAAAG
ncbi:hypothetical protein [Streptomyces sp. HC307]|uniref:hypothetical protein n=1 Tax=Streptomyces flavusporus TaxID=3385496 RepID=UPI003916FB96